MIPLFDKNHQNLKDVLIFIFFNPITWYLSYEIGFFHYISFKTFNTFACFYLNTPVSYFTLEFK